MKPHLLQFFVAMLLAGNALAGSEQIILQHARTLSDQNNARQAGLASGQPAPPAPVAPTPITADQQSLNRFQAGLAAIKADQPVAPEKKQQLAKDLLGAIQSPTKPSPEAVKQLIDDLCAAFVRSPLDTSNRTRLVQEIDAVVNPAKYPKAKMQAIFDDVQALLETSGLARKEAAKIVEEVKALSATGQSSAK